MKTLKKNRLRCRSALAALSGLLWLASAYAAEGPVSVAPASVDSERSLVVARGQYLAQLSGCVRCHTHEAAQGAALAGGRELKTPYGTLITPNITLDPRGGIGLWGAEDFVKAMQTGRRLGGHPWLPASMADAFAPMSEDDLTALYVYLSTVPKQSERPAPSQLSGVYRVPLVREWLHRRYFEEGTYRYQPEQSRAWNDGAYLTQAVMGCAQCHSPRTHGAMDGTRLFQGGEIAGLKAPALTTGSFGQASEAEKMQQLRALGSTTCLPVDWRADHRGLAWISEQDLQSVAHYLSSFSKPTLKRPPGFSKNLDHGKEIYQAHCASCHDSGRNGAIKPDDQKAWKELLAKRSMLEIYRRSIKGYNLMPPKGGCEECEQGDVVAAVRYMVSQGASTAYSLW